MAPEPDLDIWAGGDDAQFVLAGVGQRGTHQRVAHALALAGRRNFGMLEVEHIIAERGVEELRVPIGEGNDEAGLLRIMSDGRPASR
jgi:hypothetical protein